MVANIDRLIVGHDQILECKTVNAFAKWDEVPDHYRIQVEHQFIVSGKREGYLAVLIGGQQYDDFELTQDDALSHHLMRQEAEFWHHVQEDKPPEPRSAADVIALYPHDSGRTKIATPEIREIHAELMAVRKEKKEASQQEDELKKKIQIFLGEDAEILADEESGQKLATWKTDRGTEVTRWEDAFYELASMQEIDVELFLSNHRTKRYTRRFLPKEIKTS
jgi:predicted phage-related endonuclease